VSPYLNPPSSGKRKVNEAPSFKPATLEAPLILTNTFNVPIKIQGLVNLNPELRFSVNTNKANQGIQVYPTVVLQPGESVKYASVELQTSLLKISQGTKYISINVNNTLIPVAISIYDRGLLCVWEENEHVINLEAIPLCTNPVEVNFEYVALNDQK
jgi:hypothetical protein